jgi:lipopolysaccharide biosynthesis glycosyltransferase
MKVCVGILSIGKTYLAEFERLFKPSISAYCTRHGYDLKIMTDFLDPIRKHPNTISFQKCLVPDQLREYDLVIVLDADIYIKPDAPPVDTLELNGRIGIVNELAQSSPQAYEHMINIGFASRATDYYKLVGFNFETDKILNTGLMVCNPAKHADYLKVIYEKYVDQSVGHPRGFHYEQACIGYELQADKMFELMPNAWNFLYIHSQISREPMKYYFLHFAGMRGSQREFALTRHTFKSGLRWGIQK